MKKEYLVLTTIGLFIFAYVLGYLAGPVSIQVSLNPYTFLLDQSNLQKLPLTTFEIFIRSIALLFSVSLIFSLVEKNYFIKAIIVFVIALLAQLYSIQQIMVKGTLTTMQWTLPISYAGILSLILIIYYIFQGIIYGLSDKLIKKDKAQTIESTEESILKPS